MLEARNSHRKNRVKISLDTITENQLYKMYLKRNIRLQLEFIDKTKLTIRDLNCDEIENSLKEIDFVLSANREN